MTDTPMDVPAAGAVADRARRLRERDDDTLFEEIPVAGTTQILVLAVTTMLLLFFGSEIWAALFG